MMQTIIAYTIIGIAAGYTIYSVVKKFSRKNTDIKCGSSCEGCSIKDCYSRKIKNDVKTML